MIFGRKENTPNFLMTQVRSQHEYYHQMKLENININETIAQEVIYMKRTHTIFVHTSISEITLTMTSSFKEKEQADLEKPLQRGFFV